MEKSLEFPQNLITKIPLGKKYALAGSISEDNVENIYKLGVNFFDLSSSLESQLGYKDHHKVKKFINKINELKTELNLQNLQVWSNFPGIDHEACMRSIKLFNDEVIPKINFNEGDVEKAS
jgi:hypothetical protein